MWRRGEGRYIKRDVVIREKINVSCACISTDILSTRLLYPDSIEQRLCRATSSAYSDVSL